MKNLIIQTLSSIEETNVIGDAHILIISNKSFIETKKQLRNKKYDYFVCNNTLFDNNDNILYSNNINLDPETFLSFAYQNKKSPEINITNSKDEKCLTNFVKISIKYSLFSDVKCLINELEIKYGLTCKFEKGFLNFYVKNGLKNVINFLIQENNYSNIFNCCGNVKTTKLKEEKYTNRVKYVKMKKYRR